MKIIAIGDPHFRVDNIKEVEEFIEKITALVKRESPDFVICLGDLLHTHERIHTIALNKAYEFIEEIRKLCFIYVLVGNHDYIQNQQFLTQNHWMNALKQWENVCIVDNVIEKTYNDIKFIFSPYTPNGRFIEALNTLENDWKDADCIFAHQEFQGCKMGAIISTDGDKWDLDFPNVVSGHIHSKQTPQPNIYYTGSSLQHAFGESENVSIAILEFEKKSPKYTRVEHDLGMLKKRIVYTDFDNVTESEIAGSNVKLTIRGDDYNEFKLFKKSDKYKNLIDSGTKIVFKLNKQNVEPTSDTIDFEHILYNICKNANLMRMYNLVVNDVDAIDLVIDE